MHYDSHVLSLNNLSDILGNSFLQQQAPVDDTADYDNDPATDKYVLIAWADLTGNWPDQATARLFTANLNSSSTATGSTSVNFTSSSTASGWSFGSTSAVVTFVQAQRKTERLRLHRRQRQRQVRRQRRAAGREDHARTVRRRRPSPPTTTAITSSPICRPARTSSPRLSRRPVSTVRTRPEPSTARVLEPPTTPATASTGSRFRRPSRASTTSSPKPASIRCSFRIVCWRPRRSPSVRQHGVRRFATR